ncbi:MAG: hypothetical protein LC754_09145 [Acidobacteria bacterium]|nr:hypothetical protein [Acidobacteriota bacterium]
MTSHQTPEKPSQPQSDMKESLINPQESTVLEILKQKFEEGKSYATISVTTFTVYLAINGVLLKYSLDKDIAPAIPIVLSIVGIATSTLYVAVSIFVKFVRDNLARDIDHLNQRLGNPLISKQFSGLSYISISTGTFSFFGLVGWILLLVRFIRR